MDRKFDLGHVLATAVLFLTLVSSYYSQDSRIAQLETKSELREKYLSGELEELKTELRGLRVEIQELKSFFIKAFREEG